jgi:hypothetical protein
MKKSSFSFGRLAALALCAAALVFGGCDQIFENAKSKQTGSVTLNVSIEGVKKSASKSTESLFTIYPGSGGADEFDNFTLLFEATSGGAAHAPVPLSDISQPATVTDLVVGTYTVTVTATRSGGDDVVAIGSVPDVQVSTDGVPETVNVILGPKTGGGVSNGTFAYDITFQGTADSATLTITDENDNEVEDPIDLITSPNSTVSLAPGYYYADVVINGSYGGGEVIHIYSGMTSAWANAFTIGEPPPPVGSKGFTAGFGHNVIPVTVNPNSAEVGKGTDIVFTVTDGEYTNVKWYTDGNVTGKMSAVSYTVATNDLDTGVHTVTVRAKKYGKLYNELIEFLVTEPGGGGLMIVGVTPGNLSEKLATIDDDTNSADTPTTLVFETFNVSGDDWGVTIKAALDGNTKYIVFDLTACTANATIIGGIFNTSGNDFNIHQGHAYLVGLILPSSVTGVGSCALRNYQYLKTITLPAGLTAIANSSCEGCTDITRITFLGGSAVNNGSKFPNSFDSFYNNQADKSGTYVWNGDTWSKE